MTIDCCERKNVQGESFNPVLTCLKVSLPASSSASYTAGMPSVDTILLMGPVMHSALFLKASSSLRQQRFERFRVCYDAPCGPGEQIGLNLPKQQLPPRMLTPGRADVLVFCKASLFPETSAQQGQASLHFKLQLPAPSTN